MSNAYTTWKNVRALDRIGTLPLGPNTFDRYINDPKRIAFMLSRYKFAAKMLKDSNRIIDVGCGDGFGTAMFLADTDARMIKGYDFDKALIEYASTTLRPLLLSEMGSDKRLEFTCSDWLSETTMNECDGLSSLDVIEHLEPDESLRFFRRCRSALTSNGIAIFGTPNRLAEQYASEHSHVGHINLYDADRLREELKSVFSRVLMFSMNDETVHTGFDKLAHYLLAIAIK